MSYIASVRAADNRLLASSGNMSSPKALETVFQFSTYLVYVAHAACWQDSGCLWPSVCCATRYVRVLIYDLDGLNSTVTEKWVLQQYPNFFFCPTINYNRFD